MSGTVSNARKKTAAGPSPSGPAPEEVNLVLDNTETTHSPKSSLSPPAKIKFQPKSATGLSPKSPSSGVRRLVSAIVNYCIPSTPSVTSSASSSIAPNGPTPILTRPLPGKGENGHNNNIISENVSFPHHTVAKENGGINDGIIECDDSTAHSDDLQVGKEKAEESLYNHENDSNIGGQTSDAPPISELLEKEDEILTAQVYAYEDSDPSFNRQDIHREHDNNEHEEQHRNSHHHNEPVVAQPQEISLLGPLPDSLAGRKCLILDLDETLVHSSFKYIHGADFVIPVEIENQYHNVYVIKRPGVDEFMRRVGEIYEVVVFTASLDKYGDPLLDQLDIHNVVHHRLFRESCYNYQGSYIKNLAQLGRPLGDTIIIDNSPMSYIFHPQHAIPVSSWFSDIHDSELLDMLPLLEDLAIEHISDVSLILDINL